MNREIDSAHAIEVNCQSSTCCEAFVGGTAIEIELWSIDCLQEHLNPFRTQQGLVAGIAPQGQTDRGDQQLENLRSAVSITLFLLCTVPVPVLLKLFTLGVWSSWLSGTPQQQWRLFFRVCKCAARLSFRLDLFL